MATFHDFSRIVSAIYAAATQPESWISALSEVRESMHAVSSGVILAGPSGHTIQSASLPPEVGSAYRDHFCRLDYVLDAVEEGPVGLVHSGAPLVALKQNSEFNFDFMRRHQMDDGLFVRLTDGPSPACFLVAAPKRDDPFDSAENMQLVNAIVPHLQQALRTQQYFEGFARALVDAAAALDSVTHGVLVVDAKSTVLHINTAARAILSDNDGLTLQAGQIGATTAALSRRLNRAIADAITGVAGSGTSILCPRPSGNRSYVVHVLPHRSTDMAATPGRALVAVIDPERTPQPDTAVLRRLYGLTAAEAEVAVRVLRGDGLKPISEELEVSMATVKTHLQHVFDKTETHRQAELVRLLLAVTR